MEITDNVHRTDEPCEICETVGHTPMTQLDRIEAKLDELLEGKHALERMAEELKGKGPLAMMGMFK